MGTIATLPLVTASLILANVIALVEKTEPGAELTCLAHNYPFEQSGSPQERGVISYYAEQTLAQVTTFATWLQRIEALSNADVEGGRLPWSYQLSLQLLGQADSRLPGEPVKAAVEQH